MAPACGFGYGGGGGGSHELTVLVGVGHFVVRSWWPRGFLRVDVVSGGSGNGNINK